MSTKDAWSFSQLFSFESLFILFLFASLWQEFPYIKSTGVDLTILFFVTILFWSAYLLYVGGWKITSAMLLFTAPVAIFIIYATISATWSPSNNYATHKLVRLYSLVPGSILGALIIGQSRIRLHRFLRLLGIFGSALVISVIFQIFTGEMSQGFHIGDRSYLLPSRVMGASALIFIYWLTTVRQLHTRLILVGVIGTHLIAILLAGSRAAFISLIAASAIFLLLQFSLNDYELYVPTVIRDLATGGTIALGILIAALPIIDITEVRAIRRTLRIIYTGETETALLARFDHVGSSVELWIQSPLFGHGIGSYGVLFWGEDIVAYPHNIILEVLSELGLIGLLLFGTIVVLSLSRLYLFYNFLPKNMGSFLVSFILFWFISSLFSFDMTGNRYLFMSLALGYVSAGIYCSKENGVQCSDRQYSYENSK